FCNPMDKNAPPGNDGTRRTRGHIYTETLAAPPSSCTHYIYHSSSSSSSLPQPSPLQSFPTPSPLQLLFPCGHSKWSKQRFLVCDVLKKPQPLMQREGSPYQIARKSKRELERQDEAGSLGQGSDKGLCSDVQHGR
ncbi:unnamed protein product, partial [Thlaspi arvense]